MKKDSVAMICSVSELADVFQRSESLEAFLAKAVSVIAFHMRAAVCSIYLLEEDSEDLVLWANQGLREGSVGQVRLKKGRGITGMALREIRPICAGMASKHPNFEYIEGTEEERYQAFLAVPIVLGLERVGVLVVQDTKANYFDENDIRALKAIAVQLGTSIANARLLLELHQKKELSENKEPPSEPVLPVKSGLIKGRCVSDGIAVGEVRLIKGGTARLNDLVQPAPISATPEEFEQAFRLSVAQLEEMEAEIDGRNVDMASLIFSAQMLILKDSQFSGAMRERIVRGENAGQVIADVVNDYIRVFSDSRNPRVREKVQDMQDLHGRLSDNLRRSCEVVDDLQGRVIVSSQLVPSDILKYHAQGACGFIVIGGSGATAHISIIARSLLVPMVFIDVEHAPYFTNGCAVLVDAWQGNVIVEPSDEVRDKYRALQNAESERNMEVQQETRMKDGVPVQIFANINLLSDLQLAIKYKAEGVGLYRSEFPFLIRADFPSEEEQVPIYRQIYERMGTRQVYMRTLDVGGDKMLDYYPMKNEDNPFLGLRAIRFSLRHTEVFAAQIRAMLRAGAGSDVHIMFPLVASVDDFVQAKELVQQCLDELAEEGLEHAPHPKLGIMVEMPSVLYVLPELMEMVDFMSIGSNDLVQYLLAVDRTNESVADMYVPHHPSVLRAIEYVVRMAKERQVPLSICGDMVLDETLLPFLIGIGLRRISIYPPKIPELQHRIQSMDTACTEAYAKKLLKIGSLKEVKQCLQVVTVT